MALSFVLLGVGQQRAVYKITSSSGGSGTLTNQGAATPDLTTDIPSGTPLGDYIRTAVATDAVAQNRANYNATFKCTARCTTASTDPKTAYFSVEGKKNATSGLMDLLVNSDADGTVGDCEGVLEIELVHTAIR